MSRKLMRSRPPIVAGPSVREKVHLGWRRKIVVPKLGTFWYICKMRVIGTKHLLDFSSKHPPARSWIRTWLADVREANWPNSHAIKAMYPAASFLHQNLVIFNVKGNDYRMVTQVAYRTQILVVKWVGAHDAYSKMNWESYKNETHSR